MGVGFGLLIKNPRFVVLIPFLSSFCEFGKQVLKFFHQNKKEKVIRGLTSRATVKTSSFGFRILSPSESLMEPSIFQSLLISAGLSQQSWQKNGMRNVDQNSRTA